MNSRFLTQHLKLKNPKIIKFIHSEKATKFCEIFTLLLSCVVPVKSKVKISQNFVAFSEYMNFFWRCICNWKTRLNSRFFVHLQKSVFVRNSYNKLHWAQLSKHVVIITHFFLLENFCSIKKWMFCFSCLVTGNLKDMK